MYSLIVVDYNTLDKTLSYISHCREMLGIQYLNHVVIVENGDNAGALEMLSSLYGIYEEQVISNVGRRVQCFSQGVCQICYCHSGENMGYARGNNLGAQIAENLWNDPYYIVSNNDLVFREKVDLHRIWEYFQRHPDVALLGPGIVGLDGEKQSPRRNRSALCMLIGCYWSMALGGLFNRLVMDVVDDASEGECDWVSGCFMFVRAESFKKVEGFDPNTFLYAEEMIISEKFRQAGYKVAYYPAFTLLHNHGETVKKSMSVLRNLRIGFTSNSYFFKTYRNTPKLLLQIARWNFEIYTLIYRIKQPIKRLIRR